MKKMIAMLLVFILMVTLIACGSESKSPSGGSSLPSGNVSSGSDSGDTASDEVFYFKLDYPDPATSIIGVFLTQWVEEIKQASDGRIQIELFHGATLGAVTDIIDNLYNGVSDLAWTAPTIYTGRFPVTEGMNLPLLGIQSGEDSVNFAWYVYENSKDMQNEYQLSRLLGVYQSAPNLLCLGEGTTEGLDGFKNKVVKVQGAYPSHLMNELGISPISFHNSELYESIQKGVVNGFLVDVTTFATWNLYEVCSQMFDYPFFRSTLFVQMNNDSYNSLPDDLKAVIDENTGKDFSFRMAEAFEKAGSDCIESFTGVKSSFSAADIKTLEQAAANVHQIWINDMNKMGYDGEAIMNIYQDAGASLR